MFTQIIKDNCICDGMKLIYYKQLLEHRDGYDTFIHKIIIDNIGIINIFEFVKDNITSHISIESLEINEEERNKKYSYEIYRQFNKIYNMYLKGHDINRIFTNPIAEYSFRMAVYKGIVDKACLQEEGIGRVYGQKENKILWEKLKKQIPKEVFPQYD